MVLIIDNYDSFTYNLYQLVGSLQPEVQVIRNDEFEVDEIEKFQPSHIIISPGPGRPSDAGICEEVILHYAKKLPILGICLGHQAICEAFGGQITYAKSLMHGKKSIVQIKNDVAVFHRLPMILAVGRYHSLAADRAALPDELLITAASEDGEVMGIKHREHNIFGLQFHPESILTPDGGKIIANFLQI